MLTPEENALLTQTGPGTLMGALLRRYWLPALLSWEVAEPDGPPVRVRLLGEELVAFRDTQGRIGLLDEHCAHRGTSLWLGRNEACGLRCVWHGWKYDVDGQCVDQMNHPGASSFADKVQLTAYPTQEIAGIIWAYLGPPEKTPAPPCFLWTQAPEAHRHATKVIQECNWLQALEGGIDHSHVPILHHEPGGTRPRAPLSGAMTFDVETTDYGLRYVTLGQLAETGATRVSGYHFVLPFTQIRYGVQRWDRTIPDSNSGHMWVPMDEESCMVWNWMWAWGEPLTDEDRQEHRLGNGPEDVDQTTFRSRRNRDNDWLIDRAAQRTRSFTGIEGVNTQDRAVQELQGRIVDRNKEHLGPADRAIIVARQLLLDAVRTVQTGGDPPGVGESYYRARAANAVLPEGARWQDALRAEMYADSPSSRPRPRQLAQPGG